MTRMELEIIFAAEPCFRRWFECARTTARTSTTYEWHMFVSETGGPEVLHSLWKNTYPDIDVYEAFRSWKKELHNEEE